MQKSLSGFTIIEMVVVIVIGAIISVGLVQFIGDTARGYSSSAMRNKLASSGRIAIVRISTEVHNSVPYSLRANALAGGGPPGSADQCLEFIPVRAATTYINPGFKKSGKKTFEVIDFNPLLEISSPANVFAVIYPKDTADLYNYDDDKGPLALLDKIEDTGGADGKETITVDATKHKFSKRSPLNRIFIVDGPVSFCVESDKIFRYSGYALTATQPEPGGAPTFVGGKRVLITDSVDNFTDTLTAFNVDAPTKNRNSILGMEINFTQQGEVVLFNDEVLTRNVP